MQLSQRNSTAVLSMLPVCLFTRVVHTVTIKAPLIRSGAGDVRPYYQYATTLPGLRHFQLVIIFQRE
jgi:hypothetical protein